MLKKENRLTKKEFDYVFKNGNKKFSKNFMFIKPKNNLEKSYTTIPWNSGIREIKISTTISKKIYKTAVSRNKSRRIIYKILQENWDKISEKKEISAGILIATKPIIEIDKKILDKEILEFFK